LLVDVAMEIQPSKWTVWFALLIDLLSLSPLLKILRVVDPLQFQEKTRIRHRFSINFKSQRHIDIHIAPFLCPTICVGVVRQSPWGGAFINPHSALNQLANMVNRRDNAKL
jgi:hypothetical protein